MFRRREGRGTDRSNEVRFITNLTDKVITLGDIDNLEIRPGQRLDLLKIASLQRIGSSVDLNNAIKAGWIQFQDRDNAVVEEDESEEALIPAVLRDIGIGVDLETVTVTATVTTNYTIINSDDMILCDAINGKITVTLPAAIDNPGKKYHIKKIDSSNNLVVLDGNKNETIDDETTQDLTVQGDAVTLVGDGNKWWVT